VRIIPYTCLFYICSARAKRGRRYQIPYDGKRTSGRQVTLLKHTTFSFCHALLITKRLEPQFVLLINTLQAQSAAHNFRRVHSRCVCPSSLCNASALICTLQFIAKEGNNVWITLLGRSARFVCLRCSQALQNLNRYRIFGLHEFVDPLCDCFSAKIARDFDPTAALRFDATSSCIWNS
jgi:hypothetical protein